MNPQRARLPRSFFQRDPVTCARELIGCIVRHGEVAGRIVETEAYAEHGDEACHTFFRPSARHFIEKHPPGTAYVYLNYGVHWLLNFLVKGGSENGFVLIRALEPVEGIEIMRKRRKGRADRLLCSGPGRLTAAIGINGSDHGVDWWAETQKNRVGVFRPDQGTQVPPVAVGPRIGISLATDRLWRFGAAGSACLSRKFPVE